MSVRAPRLGPIKIVVAEQPRAYAFNIGPRRFEAAKQRNAHLGVEVEPTFVDTAEAFHAAVSDADAILGWRFPREKLRQKASRLAFVHLTGVGVESVLPLDWLPDGAVLTNSRGAQSAKMREVGLMALLMLQCKVPAFLTAQRQSRWDQRLTNPVAGEHAVIVGTGASGSAIAGAARDLGMRVTGINRSGSPAENAERTFPVAQLAAILPEADFLVLALPLTPQSRGLLADDMLARLRPSAGLVNVGRAGVLDIDALARRLEKGLLAGAVLDSYSEEPLPSGSTLWHTPNLVMLPHIAAGAGDSFLANSLDIFFRNAARLAQGETLENVVDAARGY